jgi:catechol 2,3-dioxygenase-like lactoylglutathione lyase family enzyme
MKAPELSLDHLAFPSFDVGATQRFYQELLGLPLVFAYSGVSEEWGGKRYIMFAYALAAGRQLVFFGLDGAKRPPDDGLPRDIRHVALTAPSTRELDRWKRRLASREVDFWEEDHGDQWSIYFSDPNGVLLEITYPASARALPRQPGAKRVILEWLARRPARRK